MEHRNEPMFLEFGHMVVTYPTDTNIIYLHVTKCGSDKHVTCGSHLQVKEVLH